MTFIGATIDTDRWCSIIYRHAGELMSPNVISDSGMAIPERCYAEIALAAGLDWARKLAGVCPATFLKVE